MLLEPDEHQKKASGTPTTIMEGLSLTSPSPVVGVNMPKGWPWKAALPAEMGWPKTS